MDVWYDKSDTSVLDACLAGNVSAELPVPFAGERSVALEQVRIPPKSLDQCQLYCRMGISVGFMCSIFHRRHYYSDGNPVCCCLLKVAAE